MRGASKKIRSMLAILQRCRVLYGFTNFAISNRKKQEVQPKLVTFSVVFNNLLYMIKYELALKLKSFLNIRVKVIITVESKHN